MLYPSHSEEGVGTGFRPWQPDQRAPFHLPNNQTLSCCPAFPRPALLSSSLNLYLLHHCLHSQKPASTLPLVGSEGPGPFPWPSHLPLPPEPCTAHSPGRSQQIHPSPGMPSTFHRPEDTQQPGPRGGSRGDNGCGNVE